MFGSGALLATGSALAFGALSPRIAGGLPAAHATSSPSHILSPLPSSHLSMSLTAALSVLNWTIAVPFSRSLAPSLGFFLPSLAGLASLSLKIGIESMSGVAGARRTERSVRSASGLVRVGWSA